MKVYIGVSKSCDYCGGDMHVLTASKPLTSEQQDALHRHTGNCAVTQLFECEVDGEQVVVNMNPGRGY
jgi:hypothetical protein